MYTLYGWKSYIPHLSLLLAQTSCFVRCIGSLSKTTDSESIREEPQSRLTAVHAVSGHDCNALVALHY